MDNLVEVYWFEQSAADVPAADYWLSPAEAAVVSSMPIPKRRQDWRLGRWTTKCAIRAYLHPEAFAFGDIELKLAPSGAPVAFLANAPAPLAISLSHRDGRALCSIAPSGVQHGCDLELIEPRSGAFAADYFTDREQADVLQLGPEHRDAALTLLWSLKECVLKALQVGLRESTLNVKISFPDLASLRHSLAEHIGPSLGNSWQTAVALTSAGQEFPCRWQRNRRQLRAVAASRLFRLLDLSRMQQGDAHVPRNGLQITLASG
jgi:4'-phosphopantetheinyl transferase